MCILMSVNALFWGALLFVEKRNQSMYHFLKHGLTNKGVRAQITSKAQGVEHINVSQDTLQGIKILLPSQHEQERIESAFLHLGELAGILGNSITEQFTSSNVENFGKLPEDVASCAKFASLFKDLNGYLASAKIQGFKWDKRQYDDEENKGFVEIDSRFTELMFDTLAQRYKELAQKASSKSDNSSDIHYDIEGYLTEINAGRINEEYMNSRFEKYLKLREQDDATEEMIRRAENELHKSFAVLKQEEQKYANMFLHDIESGDAILMEGNSLRDYINEYQHRAEDDRVSRVSNALGLNQQMLRDMMKLRLTENNINEFCRFDNLLKTVDKTKAKEFFEKIYNKKLVPPQVNRNIDLYLRKFILYGGLNAPFLCNEISE